MSPDQYAELFEAILNLRGAAELGFRNLEQRMDCRFEQMEERWDRRFSALETRMEDGFAKVQGSLGTIEARLSVVERRCV